MSWWVWVIIGIAIVVIEEILAAPKRRERIERMKRETERLEKLVDEYDEKYPS